jgi:hypothetical protein
MEVSSTELSVASMILKNYHYIECVESDFPFINIDRIQVIAGALKELDKTEYLKCRCSYLSNPKMCLDRYYCEMFCKKIKPVESEDQADPIENTLGNAV